MEDERVISFERGKQLADQLGVEFFETSAKENINVKVNSVVASILQIALEWRSLSLSLLECFRAPSRHNLRQNVRELGLRPDSGGWRRSERPALDRPTSGHAERELQLLSSIFCSSPSQASSTFWSTWRTNSTSHSTVIFYWSSSDDPHHANLPIPRLTKAFSRAA